jgi:hypothetical protein
MEIRLNRHLQFQLIKALAALQVAAVKLAILAQDGMIKGVISC